MGKVISFKPVRRRKTIWDYDLSSPAYDKTIELKGRGIVNRKVFLITGDDVGMLTISLGIIRAEDIGRYYVVDDNTYDYMVEEVPPIGRK